MRMMNDKPDRGPHLRASCEHTTRKKEKKDPYQFSFRTDYGAHGCLVHAQASQPPLLA